VVLLVAACSGSSDTGLLSNAPESSSSGGSSGSTGGSSGSTGGSSGSTGGSSGSSGVVDPPPPPDGGPKDDAGSPIVDASTPMDARVVDAAPPDPDLLHTLCDRGTAGPLYCNTGQVCCAQRPVNVSIFDKYTCKAPGNCTGSLQAEFSCDDRNDCSGTQICCATFLSLAAGGAGAYTKSACSEPAQCVGDPFKNTTALQFCDLTRTIPGDCPVGKICKVSTNVLGYGFCEAP
jgi:hypothetical protein